MLKSLLWAPRIRGASNLGFFCKYLQFGDYNYSPTFDGRSFCKRLGSCAGPPRGPCPPSPCPPPPPLCRPVMPKIKKDKPRIPANPCCPFYPEADHKKYKRLFFLFAIPVILIQIFRCLCMDHPEKVPCRDFEYMRRRTKRFPWGEGTKSLFHNDHINSLPGECISQPQQVCE